MDGSQRFLPLPFGFAVVAALIGIFGLVRIVLELGLCGIISPSWKSLADRMAAAANNARFEFIAPCVNRFYCDRSSRAEL